MAPPVPDQGRLEIDARKGVTLKSGHVDRAYSALAPVYDFIFGPVLQNGRGAAVKRMGLRPGARVLEVGVGTGLSASLYPHHCQVTGIDVSAQMLQQAQERVTREKWRHVDLHEMDAACLTFPDNAFDVVYAPYTISAVPDPVAVAREMSRVCSPGGRIIFLNHFRSTNPAVAMFERAIAPLTVHAGFRSDLDLRDLLDRVPLTPSSIDKVNVPPIWSLVTCLK